jgi:hypothetical protein
MDFCQILGLLPDKFRYRLQIRIYPEPSGCGDKRRLTYDQARHILQITKRLIKEGNLKR